VIKADGSAWCVGKNWKSMLTHDEGATGDNVLTAALFDADPARLIVTGDAVSLAYIYTVGY
jgi:hypothetical protein